MKVAPLRDGVAPGERFDKIVIAGVGLIGGSFALALRAAGAVRKIVGVGRGRANVERARALGLIDEIGENWAHALEGAELVLFAAPVGQMRSLLAQAAPFLGPDTVMTDAGSTKQDVVEAARDALGDFVDRFVPAHPIAGAEFSGADAARVDLFRDKRVVLTPLAVTSPAALERVRYAWRLTGAQLSEIPAAEHDRLFAAVSHLPHLLAYALVDMLAERAEAESLFSFAGSGFRDFTRIAGSHPEMWRDIAIANRSALLDEVDAYVAKLGELSALLAAQDAPQLAAMLERARRARARWLGGEPIRAEQRGEELQR